MNLLTLVGALPLVGAALIYLIPTKDSELVKKFALLVTSRACKTLEIEVGAAWPVGKSAGTSTALCNA